MAWRIEYDEGAVSDLKKLDRHAQQEILQFMERRVGRAADPRAFGKRLRHSKFGLWRYRWQDFRIILPTEGSATPRARDQYRLPKMPAAPRGKACASIEC